MDYVRSQSGLILAHESRDAQAIEPQLKRLDPDLALQAWPSPHGPPLWKVVRHYSRDHPPEVIASWVDRDGKPLPLAEGLVDLVRSLDRNSRVDYLDADAKNELAAAERARDDERDEEAMRDDWRFPHGRPVLHRGAYLRMHRDRMRSEGKKV